MTTIGPSLIITGEVTSQEDITIHGQVKGQIRMEEGALLVAPKGNVEAEVLGTRVTVHGKVTGNVTAAGRIELAPSAEVSGTLTTPSLVLQDGALFNGLIDMARTATAKNKAPLKFAAASAEVKAS